MVIKEEYLSSAKIEVDKGASPQHGAIAPSAKRACPFGAVARKTEVLNNMRHRALAQIVSQTTGNPLRGFDIRVANGGELQFAKACVPLS